MGKPFNPFEDDELEFQPDGATTITEAPQRDSATRVIEERTRIKPQPKAAPKALKLTFEELSDQGGDIRGATAIGSENLGADEFLTGMKREDYNQAIHRAKMAQLALPVQQVQETRIGRTIRTPIYLLYGGIALFITLLVGGGFVFREWWAYQEHARLLQLVPGQLK